MELQFIPKEPEKSVFGLEALAESKIRFFKFFGCLNILSLSLIVCSSVLAQQEQIASDIQIPSLPVLEQGNELSQDKYPPMINAPARIVINPNWNFFAGNFIYWNATQDNMEIAYPSSDLGISNAQFLMQKFEFKPGFKVAMGYNFDSDHWVGMVEYTWFRSTTSTGWRMPSANSLGGTPHWVVSDFFSSTQNLSLDLISKWKLHIDIIDTMMSRPFYQGRNLIIVPFGGLRAALIRQNLRITSRLDPSTATVSMIVSKTMSNNWAIGPRGGLQGHWIIGWGFRLEGDVAGSLLYTQFTNVTHREDNSASAGVLYSTHYKDYSTVRPMADLTLGLGWGRYFNQKNLHFDLLATYDFNIMWGQNMMRDLVNSSVYGINSQIGDLHLQGLTLSVRFDL